MIPKPVGTTTAHGRMWPMFKRDAFKVEIVGTISADTITEDSLWSLFARTRLKELGVGWKIKKVQDLYTSPADQVEKERLDNLV